MDQRSRGNLLTKAKADREKRATQTDQAKMPNRLNVIDQKFFCFFFDTELNMLASMTML